MLRICYKCGMEFEGSADKIACPSCAAAARVSVVRTRICRQCGREFPGGPRAWYCPECRQERRRDADRKHQKRGTARPIGSIDYCVICGSPYTVSSARQKYCEKCADGAVKAIDREQSRIWNREHLDYDLRKKLRASAAAEKTCVICGSSFRPGAGNPETCSEACAARLHKQSQKKWESEHKAERKVYREQQKLKMTPEEYRLHREKINAAARVAYKKRKEKQNGNDK